MNARQTSSRLRRSLVALVASLAALGAVVPATAAAAADSSGTEFWLGFPSNLSGGSELTLFIAGGEAASGTVEIPGLAFSQPFTVTPGTVTSVSLPTNAQMSSGTSTENKGIHVTADREVVVYGLNRMTATTDAYLGLPLDTLGTSHTVLGWGMGAAPSEFSVVAPQDGTTVTITPSVDGQGGHAAGTPFDVSLNRGEQFQLQSQNGQQDLTGTKVTSNHPVALFAGSQCGNVPDASTAYCDHMVEQNPPESTWGTSFLTVPLKTRLGGDTFVFVASQDGTEIRVNGTTVVTLNAGQRHQRLIDAQSQIDSSKPILVAQFSNGSTFDNVTSDPFEMHVPPFEQFQTGYTVTTPASGFRANFINIVAPNSAVGTIALDGTPIPASEFTPIGSSGFSGAQLDVSLGSHTLTGDGQPFGAFVYGFDEFDSYGYPGGLSLAPIATVRGLSLSPATTTRRPGTEHCVVATVTDQNGNPIPGVRVDFTVTGANPTSGNAVADAEGRATFCYTGNNTGDDTVTARVGSLVSGPATVTWSLTDPTPPTPPAPPAPVTPAGPAEVARIGLRIGHRALVALRNGDIVVRIICRGTAGQRCVGTVTVNSTSRRSRLGKAAATTARFNVAVGEVARVRLEPKSAIKRTLKRRGKAVGQTVVRLRQPNGSTRIIRRHVTIQTVDSRKAKRR